MNLAEIKAAAEAATEEAQQIATDFASISFEGHEARKLALGFFRLQREYAWLVERCAELEAACRRAGHGRGEGPDDCHICLALARLEDDQ